MQNRDIAMDVYETLIGVGSDDPILAWVETINTNGSQYARTYAEAYNAYMRLCDRLGVIDEDGDVEIIINSLLHNEQLVALKMFEYGILWSRSHPEM